jgi:hypothetical protein
MPRSRRENAVQQVSLDEQNRLHKLMRRHEKRLKQYPNVRSVDIGYKFTDGRPSNQLAIRVHVTRKVPDSSLADAERLPHEIEGVPVDVIQSNPVPFADFRRTRQDPILGGVSIQNSRLAGAGTLGAIVFDRNSFDPMAITNWHVLVRDEGAAGDEIIQPDAGGDTGGGDPFLGRLMRWDKDLDAAVCTLDRPHMGPEVTSRQVSVAIDDLPQPPNGTELPRVGTKVIKSGVRTGVTRGIIDGVSGNDFSYVVDPDFPPPGGLIGDHGDSGSLVLDNGNYLAVGLLWGGTEDPDDIRAFAHSMPAICEKLNIFVLDSAIVGVPWIGGGCKVLGRTRPQAACYLRVVYPSGRVSSAKGLGPSQADAQGLVRWAWTVGTHTKRVVGVPMTAQVTLDGASEELTANLEGTTRTD